VEGYQYDKTLATADNGYSRLTARGGASVAVVRAVCARHGTGSHFVTQRPSDPGIQRPGDPVDPVTLFCNELQMSTLCRGVRIELFTARVLCRE